MQVQVELNEYDDPFCGKGFIVIGTFWIRTPAATPTATPPHRVQPEIVCGAPVELTMGM